MTIRTVDGAAERLTNQLASRQTGRLGNDQIDIYTQKSPRVVCVVAIHTSHHIADDIRDVHTNKYTYV